MEDEVYYMLTYTYCDDMANLRIPFNKVHWIHILGYRESGVIKEGGPFVDGTGANFIVKHNKKDETSHPEYIAKNDPFYKNKLITDFNYREFKDANISVLKSRLVDK